MRWRCLIGTSQEGSRTRSLPVFTGSTQKHHCDRCVTQLYTRRFERSPTCIITCLKLAFCVLNQQKWKRSLFMIQ
ncbi:MULTISPECIES: hypothetical protein [Cyanophyceae]|uniref:hypothetical protein n=1 Tax=Cyanophyceae TaxID=3028117 RepID=UPI00168302F4|nr:hypothetical protein [Trichocoleus sp. FACHB-40]MBD2002907.1 hypothetical protein [Trichocoleus sp. FACHB-40]